MASLRDVLKTVGVEVGI